MPRSADAIRAQILANAGKIVRLHRRIHETVKDRHRGPRQRAAWETACTDFHDQYDQLSFPGGYGGALARLVTGDPATVEAALCFLEVRPYFFRSGYMFRDILRKARRAPLDVEQAVRLESILSALAAWRATRTAIPTPASPL